MSTCHTLNVDHIMWSCGHDVGLAETIRTKLISKNIQQPHNFVNHLAITTFWYCSRNRVFFIIFLHFECIHKISVRHSKIIHISGIRQRKIVCFASYFRQDVQCSIVNLFFSKIFFSWCYLYYRVIKVVLYYSHDVSSFDHFLII